MTNVLFTGDYCTASEQNDTHKITDAYAMHMQCTCNAHAFSASPDTKISEGKNVEKGADSGEKDAYAMHMHQNPMHMQCNEIDLNNKYKYIYILLSKIRE